MTPEMRTVIYPVKDLAQAKAVYGNLLGMRPSMDEAYYVGFSLGDHEVGLNPNGHSQGMTGPICYWHVDDIDESLAALSRAGATTEQDAPDVGGGKLTAIAKDPDGNTIGLIQAP